MSRRVDHTQYGVKEKVPKHDDRTYDDSRKASEEPPERVLPVCECWEVKGGDAERCLVHDTIPQRVTTVYIPLLPGTRSYFEEIWMEGGDD